MTKPVRRQPPRVSPLSLGLSPALIGVMTLSFMPGCTLVEKTVDLPFRAVTAVLPGGAETKPVDPVDLQESLLRFADHFMSSTTQAALKLKRNGKPIEHSELVVIKVKLAAETLAMVTSSNAIGSLVDMVMLVSAARARFEDYWMPKIYGTSGLPMVKVLTDREQQIWLLAESVLPDQQIHELRSAIRLWREQRANDEGDSLEAFASLQLVNEIKKASTQQSDSFMPSSVFKLLEIDPLGTLDPATRELTETRLFGDRALFIGQRMPQLIEWQLELLATRTLEQPEVSGILDSTRMLAEAGDRISRTVEALPNVIDAERDKLLSSLKSEKRGLIELSREIGLTLNEGDKMASSTDQALKTFSELMAFLDAQPKDPNDEPFRIKDYAEAAVEINLMSQRLNDLLETLQGSLDPAHLEALSERVDTISEKVQKRSEAVVHHALMMGLLFVAASCLMVLATTLIYQRIRPRITGSSSVSKP